MLGCRSSAAHTLIAADRLCLCVRACAHMCIRGYGYGNVYADKCVHICIHTSVSNLRQVAERLCVDSGAVQSIVAAAGTHRASKDMREAVAGCLEQLLASNSAECQMYVAHFAAPVCGCDCVRA